MNRATLEAMSKSADPAMVALAQEELAKLDAADAAEAIRTARPRAIASLMESIQETGGRGEKRGKAGGAEAAFEAFESGAVPMDPWQKAFRRRNNGLPQAAGWPLYEDAETKHVLSTDPAHVCHTPHGRAAIAEGRLSVTPDNGR